MKIEILCKSEGMQSLKIELEGGERLPLHDHPKAHVFMYVLKGKLKVAFYRYVKNQKDEKLIRLEHEAIMGPGTHQLITEEKLNLHQIEALELSEFIDVISPGYLEHENPPQWFQIESEQEGLLTLKEVPPPEAITLAKEEALARYVKKD